MRTIFICTIVWLAAIAGYGQEKLAKEMDPDVEWGDGSVMLNDGTELKGVVRFNDKNGLVSFQNGNDGRSFTARSIMGFEFFDEIANKQRLFFTLPFDDGQGKRPSFFEVLKDLGTFAIISKIDPVEIKIKSNQNGAVAAGTVATGMFGAAIPGGMTTKINQTETVYFLTPEGVIKPYLKVTRKVVDRTIFDNTTTSSKKIDKDLLEEFIPQAKYEMLLKYADDNDLRFGLKEDLIKIFEYYSTLE